eukprot:4962299-Pleurochrysis_carterae.AAC.2
MLTEPAGASAEARAATVELAFEKFGEACPSSLLRASDTALSALFRLCRSIFAVFHIINAFRVHRRRRAMPVLLFSLSLPLAYTPRPFRMPPQPSLLPLPLFPFLSLLPLVLAPIPLPPLPLR